MGYFIKIGLGMTKIKIKRVYEDTSDTDGYRVLVDRLWPRGMKKEHLKYDYWAKELTPSSDLRKWFHDDVPGHWKEFAEMYFGEWELKSYNELSTDIRFRDSYQAWIDSGGTLAFPNGESRKEFCKRSICGFERALSQALELKRAMPDKEIQMVFFVHGGTIMAIMSHYCDMDYYDYQVKNGCGYSCEVAVEGNEIVFNEIVPISL